MARAISVKFAVKDSGFNRGIKKVKAGIKGVVGMAAKIAAPLAAAAGAASALGLAFKGIKLAANFEDAVVALGTVTKDMDEARRIMEDITKFSNITPFEPDELVAATKALGAQREKLGGSDGLVDTIQRLADVSAVMGKENLPELVNATIKALGKESVSGEVTEMFSQRGIDIVKGMADAMGKSRAEVLEMRKAGKLTSADFLAGLRQMTDEGGTFFEGAIRASDTFNGKLSTVIGKFNEMLRLFATPLLEPLKNILDVIIDRIDQLTPLAEKMGQSFANAARLFKSISDEKGVGGAIIEFLKIGGMTLVNIVSRGFTAISQNFSSGIRTYIDSAVNVWKTAFSPSAVKAYTQVFTVLGKTLAKSMVDTMFEFGLAPDWWKNKMNDIFGVEGATEAEVITAADNLVNALEATGQAYVDGLKANLETVKSVGQTFKETKGLFHDDIQAFLERIRNQGAEAPSSINPNPPMSRNPYFAYLDKLEGPLRDIIGTVTKPVSKERDEGKKVPQDNTRQAIVSSLTRIGGTAGLTRVTVTPMVREQQKTNVLLEDIKRNTNNTPSIGGAVFA